MTTAPSAVTDAHTRELPRVPRAVVIVPAHNEGRTIERSLRSLLGEALPGELVVVVACNGCTDDTAERAERVAAAMGHRITVLTLPDASKARAIRAAEQVATGFPRVYLDADVTCPTVTVRAMVAAIEQGAALAVPARRLDLSGATTLARAYYEGWYAVPWVQQQLGGRGAYTLSRRARDTFGQFPDGIADDRFATTRLPRAEAVVVDEPIIVSPAARARDVVRVRTRVYAGNQQLDGPAHDVSRLGRVKGLGQVLTHQPSRLPALAVFASLTLVAKARAGWAVRRGRVTWGRDPRRGGTGAGDAARPVGADSAAQATGSAPVDVIVLTYRSARYVRECLVAVDTALETIPGARIIVVDNGSRDGVAEAVAGLSNRLELVLRDVNDGFARGCHAGASRSEARRLLFLNPDAVIEPGAVRALLLCAAEHPGAGLIGGRAVTADGTTDRRSWWGRPSLWSALCFALGLSSLFPGSRWLDPESSDRWRSEAREVSVVSGGMMLVEREAWDGLGGFDQDFFLYGEDADLSLRARQAGWSPRVCPEAVYRHRVGASSDGSNRLPLVLRGRVTTYHKHLPPPWGHLAGELLVLGTGLRALAAGLRPAGGRSASGVAAWRDSWRRRHEWRHGWSGSETVFADYRAGN